MAQGSVVAESCFPSFPQGPGLSSPGHVPEGTDEQGLCFPREEGARDRIFRRDFCCPGAKYMANRPVNPAGPQPVTQASPGNPEPLCPALWRSWISPGAGALGFVVLRCHQTPANPPQPSAKAAVGARPPGGRPPLPRTPAQTAPQEAPRGSRAPGRTSAPLGTAVPAAWSSSTRLLNERRRAVPPTAVGTRVRGAPKSPGLSICRPTRSCPLVWTAAGVSHAEQSGCLPCLRPLPQPEGLGRPGFPFLSLSLLIEAKPT